MSPSCCEFEARSTPYRVYIDSRVSAAPPSLRFVARNSLRADRARHALMFVLASLTVAPRFQDGASAKSAK